MNRDSGFKLASSLIAAIFTGFVIVWVGHNVGLEWSVGMVGFYTTYCLMRAQDKGNA